MNILYYIPNISKVHGGIYQYSLNLLTELGGINGYNFFIPSLKLDNDIKELCDKYENLHYFVTKEPVISVFKRGVLKIANLIFERFKYNYRFRVHSEIYFLIKKYNIDIVHSPHQTLPLNIEVKSILTLHDVQELHFPEFFSSKQRMVRAIDNHYSVNSASAIIVSYNHIKEDIIKFFNIDRNKIYVVLLNMSNLWFNKIKHSDNISYNLDFNSYILYPAATWKHKNHKMLINALYYLKTKKNISINLVCTGNKTEYYKELQDLVKELNLEKQIIFKGIVADRELFFLYKNALAVVIPTLYEAGSFPLYESIFLNVPVVCSNVTSLPETINDLDFIFNPKKIVDISDKIYKITCDKSYILKNLSLISKRRKELTSSNIKQKMIKIYKEILSN